MSSPLNCFSSPSRLSRLSLFSGRCLLLNLVAGFSSCALFVFMFPFLLLTNLFTGITPAAHNGLNTMPHRPRLDTSRIAGHVVDLFTPVSTERLLKSTHYKNA